ncbi:ATP-binding protein [Streptomyces sp. NPDC051567]|uniref:ATP-binding protein n=1 Tax=Streptomyces sp. NPDC051567 TaxID=3365660 RepID=UPI00379603CC
MNLKTQSVLVRDRIYLRSRRSVAAARHFTRDTLLVWGVTERDEDMLLCVSELATNAIRHGVPPGRGFLVRLLTSGGAVRIEVHDSGGGHPRLRTPHPDTPEPLGGRGLHLIAALSDTWGTHPRTPGKVVWCEFHGADVSQPNAIA